MCHDRRRLGARKKRTKKSGAQLQVLENIEAEIPKLKNWDEMDVGDVVLRTDG